MNIITGKKCYVMLYWPGGRDYFIKEMQEKRKIDKILSIVPFLSFDFFQLGKISLSFLFSARTPQYSSQKMRSQKE
jgi:hypothetical protein